jgi:hypothetical protein
MRRAEGAVVVRKDLYTNSDADPRQTGDKICNT